MGLFDSVKSILDELPDTKDDSLFGEVNNLISSLGGEEKQNNSLSDLLNEDAKNALVPKPEETLRPLQNALFNPELLTNPLVDKIIPQITGGMTIDEAQRNADKEVGNLRNLPSAIFGTARSGLEALGQSPLSIPKVDQQGMNDIANVGSNALNLVFGPAIKAARGIGGALIPEEGKTPIQSAIKDMVADPGVGVYAERFSKNGPFAFTGQENDAQRNAKIALNATAGTLAELATFNPKEVLTSLGKPSKFRTDIQKQIIDSIDEDMPKIKEHLSQINPDLPKEVIDNLTPIHVIKGAETDPMLGDYLKAKKEEVLSSGKKQMYTAQPELPSPEDIKDLAKPENLIKPVASMKPIMQNEPIKQEISDFIDEKPIRGIKSEYQIKSQDKITLINKASDFIKKVLTYTKENPIESSLGHKIFFDVDKRSSGRIGYRKGLFEYALHSLTMKPDPQNYDLRVMDSSKVKNIENIEDILRNPDSYEEENDRVNYFKKVNDKKYAVIVLDKTDFGLKVKKGDFLRYVTQLPNKSIKNTAQVISPNLGSATKVSETSETPSPSGNENISQEIIPVKSQEALFEKSEKHGTLDDKTNSDEGIKAYGNPDKTKQAIEGAAQDIESAAGYTGGTGRRTDELRKQAIERKDIAASLRKRGFIEYRGHPVTSIQDIAEIASAFRHPNLEQFQIIYVKNNKVIGHQVISSGLPNKVVINAKLIRSRLISTANRVQADSFYIAHNHPGGKTTPSKGDKELTDTISTAFAENFKGHVITDGDKFSFIHPNSKITEHKFNIPKEEYVKDRQSVPNEAMVARTLKSFMAGNKTTIIFLDNQERILGIENIYNESNIAHFVSDMMKFYGSSKYAIGSMSKETISRIAKPEYQANMPNGLSYLVNIKKLIGNIYGVESRTKDIVNRSNLEEIERLKKENPKMYYQVQEDVIPNDFEKAEHEQALKNMGELPKEEAPEIGPTDIAERAQMEIEMMDYTKGKHPLEAAINEIGKIREYKGGKEAEELREVPKRLLSKDGKPLDEVRQELEAHGFNFDSTSELRIALKALGEKQRRFILSPEVQKYLKSAKNVKKIGKLLESKISPTAFKRIINSNVGIKKIETPLNTTEEKMLRRIFRAQAKGAKKGFMAGKEAIRAEIRTRRQAEAQKKEAAKRFTPEQRKVLYMKAYSKGLIIKMENGKTKDKLQGLLRYYKDASYSELKNYINELQGAKGNPPLILKLYGDINADTEAIKLINEANKDWRDINEMEVRTLDMPRIIEKVSGLDLWDENILAQNFFDVVSGADADRFERFQNELKELSASSEGILKDTKASAELMRKFETDEKLTNSEQKVVDFLRSKYNMLIREANDIRNKLGKKPIPYRQNYMTHIRDQNLLTAFFKGDIGKSQEISNEQLDAIRKGDFTKGNMKFNKFAQKRLGKETKNDAIGNYEKYLETLLYEIYMTPAVTHARRFTEYSLLKFPHAYEATNSLLNELAGKPSSFDKLMKPVVSNALVKWFRSQIAKNALIGNINFNLVNIANITTSAGELNDYMLKGLQGFLGDKELRALAFKHSSVLNSRKSQFDADVKAISVFNPSSFEKLTVIEKAKVGAKQLQYLVEGITRIIEYNNVGSTWVGAYMKATDVFKMPQEKAFKYADTIARRTQVGYRSYELPAVMRSDTGKLFLQFQSWTFNAMNHLIYDLKLGNIHEQAKNLLNKDNPPKTVEYRKFFVLLGVLILVNELYKKMGWREPTSLTSITPRASFPAGRVISDLGTVTGADNVVKQAEGGRTSKHKEETVTKARNRLLTTVLAPYGGTQISRLMEGNVLPNNNKKNKLDAVDLYEKALREPQNYDKLVQEAKQTAVENRILIKDVQDDAHKRIRKDVTDLFFKEITTGKKEFGDKAEKIAKDAGYDQGDLEDLWNNAKKRQDKAAEKSDLIEEQSREYKPRPGLFDQTKQLIESLK